MPKAAHQNIPPAAPAHVYDSLPFVQPPRAGSRRRFWAPRVSGGWDYDFSLGKVYGEAAVRVMRDPEHADLLKNTVFALLQSWTESRDTAVVAGMMDAIGEALSATGEVDTLYPMGGRCGALDLVIGGCGA